MKEFIANCNIAVSGDVKKQLIILDILRMSDGKIRFLGVEKDGKRFYTPEIDRCLFERFCNVEKEEIL